MRLTVFTEPQQGATYDDQLRVARRAEALRVRRVLPLRPLPDHGRRRRPARSDRRLGDARRSRPRDHDDPARHAVTSATFRLPGPLAIAVAQVDGMSGGRVELGLGAGWYDEEHAAYGIPFPSTGERFDRLEEQLEIVTDCGRRPPGSGTPSRAATTTSSAHPACPSPSSAGVRRSSWAVGAQAHARARGPFRR